MKINNVEVIGNRFAYDGCHKIYVIYNLIHRLNAHI